MSSSEPEIVRMANDIARHFAVYPEAEAIPLIARHMVSFWPPEMRVQIAGFAQRADSTLSPLACRAIATLEVPA